MEETVRPVRVLVVDDEPSVLRALEVILRKKGYEVVALDSPIAATQRLGHRGLRRGHARHPHAGALGHRAAQRGEAPPAGDRGHHDDRPRHGGHRARGHEGRGARLPHQALHREARRRRARGLRGGPGRRAQAPAGPQPRAGDPARGARDHPGAGGDERADARGRPDDRRGGLQRRDRPGAGRERHRQGAGGPRAPRPQPAPRPPLRGAQLRRAHRDAARERALRPREGGLHRRQPRPQGALRGRQRRHHLPRRDRRHPALHPGPAAARAAGGRDQAGGLHRLGQGGRARHRRHPPRPAQAGPGREVPRGPLLPAERHRHPAAAAARPARRRAAAGPPLRAPLLRPAGQEGADARAAGHRAALRLPVAGQRARARERHRARRGALPRRDGPARRPAAVGDRAHRAGRARGRRTRATTPSCWPRATPPPRTARCATSRSATSRRSCGPATATSRRRPARPGWTAPTSSGCCASTAPTWRTTPRTRPGRPRPPV